MNLLHSYHVAHTAFHAGHSHDHLLFHASDSHVFVSQAHVISVNLCAITKGSLKKYDIQ